MKKKRDIGIGRIVMTRPGISTSLIRRPGEIGHVKSIDADGNVMVSFGAGNDLKFAPAQLVTLCPRSEIDFGFQNNFRTLSAADFKLYRLILDELDQNRFKEALEKAWTNDIIQFLCTTSFEDWQDKQREKLPKNPGMKL